MMMNPERGECSEPPAKRLKRDPEPNEEDCRLLQFSDDILLMIFSYLRQIDLMAVSLCCKRLAGICQDRTFWVHVDFRPFKFTLCQLKKIVKKLLPTTKSLVTCGFHDEMYTPTSSHQCFSFSFFQDLTDFAPYLTTFITENHCIDASKIRLRYFPSTLEHLALINCQLTSLPTDKSYFHKIKDYLPNIKILDLSGCQWFMPHSLLALCKSNTLQELRLKGCTKMEECVPYASLAANFGFIALQILDLRLTWVGDSELGCFNRTGTLTHLYLEAPELMSAETPPRNTITDIGVTSLGNGRTLPPGVVIVGVAQHRRSSNLTNLVLRNYTRVTDISLQHAARCLKHLKFLDVTGTSCSLQGVLQFRIARPDVTILSHYQV